MLKIENGILQPSHYISSPNYDQRPAEMDIDMVVLHCISLPPRQFGGPDVINLFLNQLDTSQAGYETLAQLKVSAHLFIRRDGQVLQFVPFHLRAWHAGVSSYEGRTNCNDFSIGIELEGCDDLPSEERQYQVLADVLELLMVTYPKITQDRIVGHCDVAPLRKTDPGPAFDWKYLQQLISEEVCI